MTLVFVVAHVKLHVLLAQSAWATIISLSMQTFASLAVAAKLHVLLALQQWKNNFIISIKSCYISQDMRQLFFLNYRPNTFFLLFPRFSIALRKLSSKHLKCSSSFSMRFLSRSSSLSSCNRN